MLQGFGAGVIRRTRSIDPDIPAESTRSASQHIHSAKASGVTWGGGEQYFDFVVSRHLSLPDRTWRPTEPPSIDQVLFLSGHRDAQG